MPAPKKRHFSTHAELKNVIGQDLINDDNIAIIELVKNGADAGAKKILIEFLDSAPKGSSLNGPLILIADDGDGMSSEDIRDKWLNIAYSEKKQIKSRRVLAGNKGVGRFACDRLGRRLDMFTRRKRGPLIHIAVDWTAFESKRNSDFTIQKVDVLESEIFPDEMTKLVGTALKGAGTVLAISEPRQEWTRDRLLLLRRNLERFVNPIAALDAASVTIEVRVPRERVADKEVSPHERVSGVVENQVFENLRFKTTYVEMSLDGMGERLTTELHHEGRRIYRLVEESAQFSPLRGVRVVLHYMSSYKKAYFKRQTGLHAVEFGSIFLFVNGFRVSPYGDRDNDWLQLDSRKAQGMNRYLGVRELLGLISVTDPATKLRIVSNREGVVRGDAYSRLASRDGLFYLALKRLEKFVVSGLNWDSVPLDIKLRLDAGEVPGDEGMPGGEIYTESGEKKRRRIALDVLRIIDADAAKTRELEIDRDILDALSQEREDEVKNILDKFSSFDAESMGHDLKLALGRVRREFDRQKQELSRAVRGLSRRGKQVERLRTVARGAVEKNLDLERQVKTQASQIMFSRVAATSDKEQLMLLHHQAGIYAQTARNYLEKAIGTLRRGDLSKTEELVGKALSSISRVITVSEFATKANFLLKTGALTTDIAQFIQEYLQNVAKDSSAQNLKLTVRRDNNEPFVMRFKPIDLAIVFDNIASNSNRARARTLLVEITRPTENELRIDVADDGPGLSTEVQPPEKIFERGVTTTNGSGLGLYHVRETVQQMGGAITILKDSAHNFGLTIRLFK